jgi:hypothetical protein
MVKRWLAADVVGWGRLSKFHFQLFGADCLFRRDAIEVAGPGRRDALVRVVVFPALWLADYPECCAIGTCKLGHCTRCKVPHTELNAVTAKYALRSDSEYAKRVQLAKTKAELNTFFSDNGFTEVRNSLIEMGLDVFSLLTPFERVHCLDIGLTKWVTSVMSIGANREDLNSRFGKVEAFPGLKKWDAFTDTMESGRLAQGADFREVGKVIVFISNGLSWNPTMPRVSASGQGRAVQVKSGADAADADGEASSQEEEDTLWSSDSSESVCGSDADRLSEQLQADERDGVEDSESQLEYEVDETGSIVLPRDFGTNFTMCVSAYFDFQECLNRSTHTESTLRELEGLCDRFRYLWKMHLSPLSAVGLNIPKFHLVTHAVDQIRQWGARDICSVEKMEQLHVPLTKDSYANTNKRVSQVPQQMARRLDLKAMVVDAGYCLATSHGALSIPKGSVRILQPPESHEMARRAASAPASNAVAVRAATTMTRRNVCGTAQGANVAFPPILLCVESSEIRAVSNLR